MITRLGVLVPDFGPTQLIYQFVTQSNQILSSNNELDIIGFFEHTNKYSFPPQFATMYLDEAWGYSGTLIATTLSTAIKLIEFPAPEKKLFYVWDLEWIRIWRKDFDSLAKIYRHPDLQLIARSKPHAEVIENVWNLTKNSVPIVHNFNIRNLLQCLN